MSIPEEAIEAASDEVWSMTGGSPDSRVIAAQAIEAAMPAIEKDMRERITQEIEARRFDYPYTRGSSVRNKAWSSGIAAAAAIVRSGTR